MTSSSSSSWRQLQNRPVETETAASDSQIECIKQPPNPKRVSLETGFGFAKSNRPLIEQYLFSLSTVIMKVMG